MALLGNEPADGVGYEKNMAGRTRSHSKEMNVQMVVLLTILVLANIIKVAKAEEFGSLRLCPAGGRSFMIAWDLACEMKRKKRSLSNVPNEMGKLKKRKPQEGYRPATLTEIMKICCQVGCEVRDLLAYCDPFGPWNS